MKKISEMTLEELQDYALTLEGEKAAGIEREKDLTGKIDELSGLNKTLQKRNNELFRQIEAQDPPVDNGSPAPDPKPESYEELLNRIHII